MLVALAGGVGAARLLQGMVQVVDPGEITAVVNTGDDMVLHGLYICPDLDTVTYTLSGLSNTETGWGVRDETWSAMDALERLGGEHWFRLGDRDLATHLYRTQRLFEGASLAEVTAEITTRLGVPIRLVPMSNDPVRTRLTTPEGDDLAFQEYFVRRHHDVEVASVRFAGAEVARPTPGVLELLHDADQIVICPSNPIVSIGPVLALAELADVIESRRADVTVVSPIVGGKALKGPADRLMVELGHESSVVGVAKFYAPFASTLVIDEVDAALAPEVEKTGLHCVVTDTIMSDPSRAAALCEVICGR